jgi:hypothetical protein
MAYYWSVQKLANRIAWAYEPLGKALHDAVTKGVFHSVIMDDNGQIKVVEINTQQDGKCKHCTNGCVACDARKVANVLP